MPKSVLDAYCERGQLGVHGLTGRFRSVRTLLIWRRDAPHAKVAALAQALQAPPQKGSSRGDRSAPPRRRAGS